jgi:hypothetical protein
MDAVAKRKKYHHYPCRELNPARPARSLISTVTELPRLLALLHNNNKCNNENHFTVTEEWGYENSTEHNFF